MQRGESFRPSRARGAGAAGLRAAASHRPSRAALGRRLLGCAAALAPGMASRTRGCCWALSPLHGFELKEGLTWRNKSCSKSSAFYTDSPRSSLTEPLIRDRV